MLSFKGFFGPVARFFMLKADVFSFEIEYNENNTIIKGVVK